MRDSGNKFVVVNKKTKLQKRRDGQTTFITIAVVVVVVAIYVCVCVCVCMLVCVCRFVGVYRSFIVVL